MNKQQQLLRKSPTFRDQIAEALTDNATEFKFLNGKRYFLSSSPQGQSGTTTQRSSHRRSLVRLALQGQFNVCEENEINIVSDSKYLKS